MPIDSRGRYIPGRKGARAILFVFFCILFLPLIFVVPYRRLGDTALAFTCAALIFGYFYSAFYESYAYFEGKNFHMVKILIFRNTVPLMSVESLKHKYTFAGAFSGIEVTYKSESGKVKRAEIPIGPFGKKNVAAILHKFVEMNSAIKIDHLTQKLMERHPEKTESS